jgi:hypothetical protein
MGKLDVRFLIEEVLSDLINNVTFGSIALKIQMISHLLDNKDFSNWISKELNGYSVKDNLPKYRIINTEVIADLFIDNGVKALTMKGHSMPLYLLKPEEAKKISTIRITNSISSIESMSNKENLSCPISEYEKIKLSHIYDNCTIINAHKPISSASFQDIVFQFKSKLLSTFMELNDNVFNNEIDIDIKSQKKEISDVINQTINAGIVSIGNGEINVDGSTIEKK